MNKSSPIGIFDSGVGGITIWRCLRQVLPNENYIYFSDNKNMPYGEKTTEEIYLISKTIVDYLIKKHCKIIIIACNTATMYAIKQLRKEYLVPFIGIEPATKPAIKISSKKRIGILATKGTLESTFFKSKSSFYQQNGTVKLFNQECIGLASAIENGNEEEINRLLKTYVVALIEKDIDTLVLGCTHYPLVKDKIQKLISKSIELLDPSMSIAKHTNNILLSLDKLSKKVSLSETIFLTTKSNTGLKKYLTNIPNQSNHTIKFVENLELNL